MIYTYRQWSFTFDPNLDGVVTISDAWPWFKWAFFYPGDAAIWGLINYSASLTTYFEISPSNYGGGFSGVFSFLAWLTVWATLNMLLTEGK